MDLEGAPDPTSSFDVPFAFDDDAVADGEPAMAMRVLISKSVVGYFLKDFTICNHHQSSPGMESVIIDNRSSILNILKRGALCAVRWRSLEGAAGRHRDRCRCRSSA